MDEKKKTGLVLEGGGMRGIYTAGVLDVFLENGLTFDGVIGVSAGAIHGCSFVAGQRGRSIRYYKKYCKDPRFMSIWNFLRTGELVDAKFCYEELPNRLDPYDYDGFEKNKETTKFYVVCSNLETGKAEYKRLTDMRKEIGYLRASASLPYGSKIVAIDGKKLLDGGCTDSIPVKAFQKLGYERNVVVLTREPGYRKKQEHKGLARIFYRKYPRFAKALEDRPAVYNRTVQEIEDLKAAGEVFVIQPKEPLTIGRMERNRDALVKTYLQGRRDALERLDDLKKWRETQ